MKIYTKTGDRGDTRLFDGTRVRKHDDRVEAYGAVDELNSFIGAAASFLADQNLVAMLAGIQKDLFSVGAQLAKRSFRFLTNGSRHWRPPSIVLKRNCLHSVNSSLQAGGMRGLCSISPGQFAAGRNAEWSASRKKLKSTLT